MPTPNRPSQQDRFRKVVAAIPRYLSNITSIVLNSVVFTPATLIQFFLDQIKLLDDATNARAALHAAVTAIKANKSMKGPTIGYVDNVDAFRNRFNQIIGTLARLT